MGKHDCNQEIVKEGNKTGYKLVQSKKRGQHVKNLLLYNDRKFWKEWRKLKPKRNIERGLDQTQKLTGDLLRTFGKKYVNSCENKELLNEFLVKYEDEAIKYKNKRDM